MLRKSNIARPAFAPQARRLTVIHSDSATDIAAPSRAPANLEATLDAVGLSDRSVAHDRVNSGNVIPSDSLKSSFKWTLALIGAALFASGAAGLVNQVVWQRALKVFLGGSETICSTVVVLVFMGGLGLGSVWMSGRTSRLKNPLRTFALLECALAAVNLAICGLLSTNLSDSVFALQRLAVAGGVPLLFVYASVASLILFIPCLLMGATMPVAAEACQRNLRLGDSRLLGLLFFINTLGSVLGTVVSSGWMMSHLGLLRSMGAAAISNLIAGSLLLVVTRMHRSAAAAGQVETTFENQRTWRKPSLEEMLAFGLGFCSLAYEMFLFRLIPLRHEPLPFTFAAVLAGFLTWWSLGAALSSKKHGPSIGKAMMWCGIACLAALPLFVMDSLRPISGTGSLISFVIARTPYFLPCLGFGYLFARVASRAAKSWGKDVGRVYGWNTVGSCLGIVCTTFIGYEMPFYALVVVIALLLFAMQIAVGQREEEPQPWSRVRFGGRFRWMIPSAAAGVIVVASFAFDCSQLMPGRTMYSGRDGVIILKPNGDLVWDGLWHSKLSRNNDHVGTHNWNLAVAPVVAHSNGTIEDVCVIGVGTGITASTLAKLDSVRQVDAFDISHVLDDVYRDHPDGTLNLLTNPKIHLIWQDARTGLALRPKLYDIIQTQPLYLKQSGSSLLNSAEFMRLVRSRLKPGGVFCLYSNGTPEQAFVLRETADSVFDFRESFFNGYLLVLSNEPIVIDHETLAKCLLRPDPFWNEVQSNPSTSSADSILSLLDTPRLPAGGGELVVTDDRPILEYPAFLARRVDEMELPFQLAKPIPAHQLPSAVE